MRNLNQTVTVKPEQINGLQVFSNGQFGQVRTFEQEGQIYFCGSDVGKALGYKDTVNALKQHCKKDGVVKHHIIDSLGRQQEANFISEGNLYRLIANSVLPSAEEFEVWIFDEILPTIRKTGGYSMPTSTASPGEIANLMREWRLWATKLNMPSHLAMESMVKFMGRMGIPFPEDMIYQPQENKLQLTIFNIQLPSQGVN